MAPKAQKNGPPLAVVEAFVRAQSLHDITEADPSQRYGKALAILKARIAGNPIGHDRDAETIRRMTDQALFNIDYLAGIKPDQPYALPIAPDDARLLVDAVCFKRGYKTRAEVWASLGISPNTGTAWLDRNREGMKRWPPFDSLRRAAMED